MKLKKIIIFRLCKKIFSIFVQVFREFNYFRSGREREREFKILEKPQKYHFVFKLLRVFSFQLIKDALGTYDFFFEECSSPEVSN